MTTVLRGGRIEAFDAAGTVADAIAFRGGVVAAIGSETEVRRVAGDADRIVDLDGATVWPGFIDTHLHFEKASHELAMVRLEGARSLAELLEIVRTRVVRQHREGSAAWIRCLADNEAWHEENLAEGRLPTAGELDAVTGDVPTYLYRRPDRAVVNSAGRELVAELLDDGYDPENGWLTGPAVRTVNDRIYQLGMADGAHRRRILADASRTLLRHGITTVVDPGLAGGFENAWALYTEAFAAGEVAQRVRLMNRIDWRRPLADELDRIAVGTDPLMTRADGRLEAWGVKILTDGEFATAWMRRGEEIPNAKPHYSVAEIQGVVELCADRGWPLTLHAMGGGAIEALTSAVAAARASRPDGRFRIKLAHAFLLDFGDVLACNRLGIDITVNPPLSYVYAREMRRAWGPLAGRAMPLSTMERLGVRFAAGSDTHPLAPLHGAWMAVTRRAWDGSDLGGHEAISPRRAVEMYTRDAGEHVEIRGLGTLAIGAPADATVWTADPFDAVDDWPDMRPADVWVAGRPALEPKENDA